MPYMLVYKAIPDDGKLHRPKYPHSGTKCGKFAGESIRAGVQKNGFDIWEMKKADACPECFDFLKEQEDK